ncbi:DUF4307 domain-containing protein [Gryllotalpicola ginsengisoli]|uniref:DUF4307 domain-containing protein n=1 Tax=Gryllotalpicola ginsengisoli TaxID=444608 RepID=UPI0003B55EB9|nr:DUF4307 domain-containing protein [Gryllotalpicola ginsengisoli]
MPAGSPAIDRRYGRTAAQGRRMRWLLISLGAFIALVMILWAVWGSGLGSSTASLQATDTANQVVDSSHVQVSFTVDAPPHTKVSCAVQAQNVDFTVVGYAVVHLDTGASGRREVTKTLVTYEPGVSGSLDKCWLP